jgi:hypothetical protein
MERTEILAAAERIVCGDRDVDYGSPEYSFTAIANLWASYLLHRAEPYAGTSIITAKDVAAMMILFKIGRIATGKSKDDNWIDAAGYAACGGEIDSKDRGVDNG